MLLKRVEVCERYKKPSINHSGNCLIMFQKFFKELRSAKIPVSIREYLTLLEGVDKNVANDSLNEFYYLSRTTLVKDERDLDKFDQVFLSYFSRNRLFIRYFWARRP